VLCLHHVLRSTFAVTRFLSFPTIHEVPFLFERRHTCTHRCIHQCIIFIFCLLAFCSQDEARHRKEVKSRLRASLPPAPEAFSALLPSSPSSSPQLAPQPQPLSAVPQPAPLALAAGAAEDVSGSISAGDASCITTAAAAPNHKPPRQQQQLPSFSRIARDGVLKASDRHFPSLGATVAAAPAPKVGKGSNSPSLKPQHGWGVPPPPAPLPLTNGATSEKSESVDRRGDSSRSSASSASASTSSSNTATNITND